MTWAINRRQFPGGKAMLRGEGDREAKRLLVNCGCRENITIPEAPLEGEKSNLSNL